MALGGAWSYSGKDSTVHHCALDGCTSNPHTEALRWHLDTPDTFGHGHTAVYRRFSGLQLFQSLSWLLYSVIRFLKGFRKAFSP